MTTDTTGQPTFGRFTLVPGRIAVTRFRVRGETSDDALPAEVRALHMRAYTEMERVSQRIDGLGYIVPEENLQAVEETMTRLQTIADQFNWLRAREGSNYVLILEYVMLPYASSNPDLERFVVRDILATLKDIKEKVDSKNKRAIMNSSLFRTYGKMAMVTSNPRYRALLEKAFDDLRNAQSLSRRGLLETANENLLDSSHLDAAITALSKLEAAHGSQGG